MFSTQMGRFGKSHCVLHVFKLNIFVFWTAGWTNKKYGVSEHYSNNSSISFFFVLCILTPADTRCTSNRLQAWNTQR